MATNLWVLVTCVTITCLMVDAAPFAPPLNSATSAARPERIATSGGMRIPLGFEAFEHAVEARSGSRKSKKAKFIHMLECPEVEEPVLPTEVPSWASADASQLRAEGFEELVLANSGEPAGAFVSGEEVVIKTCSAGTLKAVMLRTKVNWSDKDPFWDIYFDCDSTKTWTIKVSATLQFGRGSKQLAGTWRLLAPHKNVILDGDNKRRIMKVMALAHVIAYGLTFARGASIKEGLLDLNTIPAGGWSGGAVLVNTLGALTAYYCDFYYNKALSHYARWGGGGAIKGDTESFVLAWGCTFRGNQGSVGGAIASSSAQVVYVRECTFDENAALGGLDDAIEAHGREKNRILVRGGAIRVDSVTGHDSTQEHVLLCNSEFKNNKIIFSKDTLDRFGYTVDDLEHVRAAGAAVTAWNKEGTLLLESGDQRFLTVKGCLFQKNEERVDYEGSRLGAYVFEVEGAGHCRMEYALFRNNRVDRAITRLDNSIRFNDGMRYEMTLDTVRFHGNGRVFNMEFHAAKYESICHFTKVDGIKDSSGGDCKEKIKEAIKEGRNLSVEDPDASPTPLPPSPILTPTPMPE